MAEALFKTYGYKVATAQDNATCIKKIDNFKPDLLFIPLISHGALPKDISVKFKDTKVVYLTRVRLTELERQELITKKGNPVDVLYYPIDPKRLLYVVRTHLGENGN